MSFNSKFSFACVLFHQNPYLLSKSEFSRVGEYAAPEVRSSNFAPEYSGTAYSHRRHTLDPSYVQRLTAVASNTAYDAHPLFASSFKELDQQRSSLYGGFDRNAVGNKPDGEEQTQVSLQLDDSDDADERMKRFYGEN